MDSNLRSFLKEGRMKTMSQILMRRFVFMAWVVLSCIDTVQAVENESRPLIVGTKMVRPFAYKSENGEWTGISIELWQKIALKIDRKYEWQEVENTNDLIKQVENGRFDVAIAAITVTPARAKQVDFSNSVFTSGVGIAARRGQAELFGIIKGLFSANFLDVFVSLVTLLSTVGFIMWLLERKKNSNQFEPGIRGLWSGFWWSVVTMMTVGYGDKVPVTILGRLLGIIWMFASVITISTFTAAIATALTTARIESQVRGKDDLMRVTVGAKQNEAPESFLKEMGIRPHGYSSVHDGLHAIENGEIIAFVHDTPVIQSEIANDDKLEETVMVLSTTLREEEYGIAVRKPTNPILRNDLREEINIALLEIKQSGEYTRILKRYLGNN